MAYNTGNPVGSRSPKDLLDNSENLDHLVNDTSITERDDRLGVPRKTWHGMETDFDAAQVARQTEFDTDQADRAAEWAATLAGAGYIGTGASGAFEDYDTDGPLTIDAFNEIFTKDGEFYRAKPGTTLPYTTTGTWATDQADFVAVGDAALRSELAAEGGALLVRDAIVKCDDLAGMKALTGLVDGQAVEIVSTGRAGLFRWDSTDLSAEVAADSESGFYIAPDSDATGASGAWVRTPAGRVNLRWFGAAGDGVTNDTAAITAWAQWVATNGGSGYAPDGHYMTTGSTVAVSANMSLVGSGPGSHFQLIDGTITGDFRELFNFDAATAGVDVTVKGLSFDMNRRGQPAVLAGGSYDFEHCHIIAFLPDVSVPFGRIEIDGIRLRDPVADGISFSGNSLKTYADIIVSNVSSYDRQATRSDITTTGSFDNAVYSNCIIDKFEVEVNSLNESLGNNVSITNVIARNSLDVLLNAPDTFFGKLTMDNCQVHNRCTLGDFDARISNCVFEVSGQMRLIDGAWRFSNCSFRALDGLSPGAAQGVIYQTEVDCLHVEFNHCTFSADATVTAADVGYYYHQSHSKAGARVAFKSCEFLGGEIRAAYMRSGDFTFTDCRFEYSGGAAIFHDTISNTTDWPTTYVTLKDNFASQPDGFIYQPPISGGPMDLRSTGNRASTLGNVIGWTRYDKITALRGGPGTIVNVVDADDYQSDAAPTTGRYVPGQRVTNTNPSVDGNNMMLTGWRCTAAGAPGTWTAEYASSVSPAV